MVVFIWPLDVAKAVAIVVYDYFTGYMDESAKS